MHNWVAGEEITANKLNQLNPEADTRISQAEHNILELYLENYYAGKNTPFQGLFFDGFSDSNKSETTNGGTNVSGIAGQNKITLNSTTELGYFNVNDLVHIFDATKQEIKRVISKALNALESNLASFLYSTTNASYWSDNGQQSGTRELRWSWNSNPPGSYSSLSKTFNVNSGQQYTFKVTTRYRSFNGSQPWLYTRVYVDGVEIGSYNYFQGDDRTVNHSFTFTPASSTCQIEIRSTWEASGGGSSSYYVLFNYSNFELTQGYVLTLDGNLGNSYSNGGVKKVTASFDTGSKRLTMTGGVGDLKKVIYQSIPTVFTQLMARAKLWIMRNLTLHLHPIGNVIAGANQVAVTAPTGSFMNGDTIELVTSNKLYRERKLVSGVSESGGGPLTLGTYTGATKGGTGTTMTFSKTIAAGNNRCLVVGVVNREDNDSPIGVTFNGFALTKVTENLEPGSANYSLSIWKLESPQVMTANIVITFGSSKGGSVYADALDFANYAGFGNAFKQSTIGYHTDNIESSTNGYVIEYIVYSGDPQNTTFTTGQIVRQNQFGWAVANKVSTGVVTAMGYQTGNFSVGWKALGICVLGLDPNITLIFAPVVSLAGGFTTNDWVDRVDVLPQVSIVETGTANNYEHPTYQESVEVMVDGEVYTEDEYEYIPALPKEKVQVKVELTRGNTGLTPYAKRLGVSLNT